MQEHIEQLEDRVGRAIDQLRRVTGERDTLRSEVHELRESLETTTAPNDDRLDRGTVLTDLRRALEELRAE